MTFRNRSLNMINDQWKSIDARFPERVLGLQLCVSDCSMSVQQIGMNIRKKTSIYSLYFPFFCQSMKKIHCIQIQVEYSCRVNHHRNQLFCTLVKNNKHFFVIMIIIVIIFAFFISCLVVSYLDKRFENERANTRMSVHEVFTLATRTID